MFHTLGASGRCTVYAYVAHRITGRTSRAMSGFRWQATDRYKQCPAVATNAQCQAARAGKSSRTTPPAGRRATTVERNNDAPSPYTFRVRCGRFVAAGAGAGAVSRLAPPGV